MGGVATRGARFVSWLSLPKLDGTIVVGRETCPEFLSGDVRIVRDKFGVAHVYSRTKRGLIFGQAWVTAQERLFSMDLLRRVALGTLAEIKAEALLIDRVSRTFGFAQLGQRDAEYISESAKKDVRAFCAGMNSFMASSGYRRPVEAFLAGIQISPFTVPEMCAIYRLYSWSMNRNWLSKVSQVAFRQALGEKRARDLSFARILSSIDDLFPCVFEGSNSFAVSGKYSESGLPLMEADPHLRVKNPSTWLQFHLVCDTLGLDAMGFTIIGAWGINIGRNQDIAYGLTLSFADVFEVYIEKEHPSRKNYFLYDGKYRECKIRREIIKVKGRDEPHVEVVRTTTNGPLLSGLIDFQGSGASGKYKFSITGTAMHEFEPRTVTALCDFFLARNWKDFVRCVRRVREMSVTIVYADVRNNIGLLMTGAVPCRSERAVRNANCPMPGWSSAFTWKKFRPFPPAILNPRCGYVIAANNDVFGNKPYYISNVYYSGQRACRIKALLEGIIRKQRRKVTLDDMQQICFDVKQHDVSLMASYAKVLVDWPWTPKLVREAASRLVSFDGVFTATATTPSLHVAFESNLQQVLFRKEGLDGALMKKAMGVAVSSKFLPKSEFLNTRKRVIRHLFKKYSAEAKRKIIYTAMKLALSKLRELIPESKKLVQPTEILDSLEYGKIHRIRWAHALDKYFPSFSIGPRAADGGYDTVSVASAFPDGEQFDVVTYPNCRLVGDLGNPSRWYGMLYPGQSGNVSSAWYGDCVEAYFKCELRPMFQGDDVEENKSNEMVLSIPVET